MCFLIPVVADCLSMHSKLMLVLTKILFPAIYFVAGFGEIDKKIYDLGAFLYGA